MNLKGNKKIFPRNFSIKSFDLFNPTEQHLQLRQLVQNFCENEVKKQKLTYDQNEIFNVDLFRKLGEIGLLGITVDEQYGGSGMDATAAIIAHEEVILFLFFFLYFYLYF